MSRIFLNYRRDDTAGYAGRLYDALAARFGDDQVFMDIDALEPGVDFVEVVEKAVNSADIFIALIGERWLTATDAKGRRRLDNPHDYVRLEIQGALARGVRLIPVLINRAEMPSPEDLPDDLQRLARRNALEVSDGRWRYDVDRLLAAVEKTRAQLAEAQRQAGEETATTRIAEEAQEAERARQATQEAQRAHEAQEAERARQATQEAQRAHEAQEAQRALDEQSGTAAWMCGLCGLAFERGDDAEMHARTDHADMPQARALAALRRGKAGPKRQALVSAASGGARQAAQEGQRAHEATADRSGMTQTTPALSTKRWLILAASGALTQVVAQFLPYYEGGVSVWEDRPQVVALISLSCAAIVVVAVRMARPTGRRSDLSPVLCFLAAGNFGWNYADPFSFAGAASYPSRWITFLGALAALVASIAVSRGLLRLRAATPSELRRLRACGAVASLGALLMAAAIFPVYWTGPDGAFPISAGERLGVRLLPHFVLALAAAGAVVRPRYTPLPALLLAGGFAFGWSFFDWAYLGLFQPNTGFFVLQPGCLLAAGAGIAAWHGRAPHPRPGS